MEDRFKAWVAMASHYIGEHFDYCKPFLDVDCHDIHPTIRFVSTQLYLSCHFSTESSLILLQHGQEWDSEVLNRSIMEGVTKYIYMMNGNEDDVLTKINEFWEVIPGYAAIKRSDRAKALLDDVDDETTANWRSIQELVLTSDTIKALRGDTNKHERKQLEERWSFGNIIKEFGNSEDEMLSSFVHLAYNYGMSSNLIHKDGSGVGMIWERCTRTLEEQGTVKTAHIARSISDLCTFAEMRTLCLFRFLGKEPDFIGSLRENYQPLFESLQEACERFRFLEYKANS